jgi:methyl-branched lipid omega-hydroxylase
MISGDDVNQRNDQSEHLAHSAFWRADSAFRHRVFAALRANEPVRWYPPTTSEFSRPCTGFWALTRYEDVWSASRNPSSYCSSITIDIEESPEELDEFAPTMINLDDPEHARLRRLVSAGFTPKHVAKLDGDLQTKAAQIIDDVVERFGDGMEFDFVAEVAARLPLDAISSMLGVPPEEQGQILDWTNLVVTPDDPAVGIAGSRSGLAALADYARQLGAARLASPKDDLTSLLVHADVDGERLSTRDFVNFFILLVSAGNETTRNAISHGMRLLTLFPEQRRILFDDFGSYAWSAAEEIVRFETPISNMCRVLTKDVVIHGTRVAAGEKVALWYPSANRDGEVFADPDQFDVRRPTTPQQVGYGGGGPHFCLGANLARREIVVMFDEIRRRVPSLQIIGEPIRPLSMGLNAISHLPASLRP